jgi:hypothetical protein
MNGSNPKTTIFCSKFRIFKQKCSFILEINRIFSGKNNQIKSQSLLHGNSTEAEILIKPALKLNFGILEALASLELAMSVTHSLIMKVRHVTNQTGLHGHSGSLRSKNNQTFL